MKKILFLSLFVFFLLPATPAFPVLITHASQNFNNLEGSYFTVVAVLPTGPYGNPRLRLELDGERRQFMVEVADTSGFYVGDRVYTRGRHIYHSKKKAPVREPSPPPAYDDRPAYSPDDRIHVIYGTYGRNCGAQLGNRTEHLARGCNGKNRCVYTIRMNTLSDPAPKCLKNYIAEWRCGNSAPRRATAAAEAGYGSQVVLYCP